MSSSSIHRKPRGPASNPRGLDKEQDPCHPAGEIPHAGRSPRDDRRHGVPGWKSYLRVVEKKTEEGRVGGGGGNRTHVRETQPDGVYVCSPLWCFRRRASGEDVRARRLDSWKIRIRHEPYPDPSIYFSGAPRSCRRSGPETERHGLIKPRVRSCRWRLFDSDVTSGSLDTQPSNCLVPRRIQCAPRERSWANERSSTDEVGKERCGAGRRGGFRGFLCARPS